MRFERAMTMRDGGRIVLGSLDKKDAAAAIWLMRKTAGETNFLMRELDECAMTIAQEEEFIARMNGSQREALIGAFIDGELVGMANVAQIAPRFRVRHRAAVGISLVKAYWGRGIGTAMMRALIELAKGMGYEQLELEVVENNARAVGLYERMGFESVGCIPHAFKYRDDSYADLLLMTLTL